MNTHSVNKLSDWQRATALVLLIAMGLAGNWLNYPIFLNIEFLFGSIFAMLALQLFGWGAGVLAAILIASVTYHLWNHPYAIVIMAAELVFVGWIMRRRVVGLVLADGLYWLFVGMPLVYVFYRGVMDVPLENTTIEMAKQAINGIANTLLARLLFTGFMLTSRSGQVTYRDLVYNLLTAFALYPALFLVTVASQSDFLVTDRSMRTELQQSTRVINNYLAQRVHERSSAFDSPLVDEFDRSFIPTMKQAFKPALSEVAGSLAGAVSGSLSLEQIGAYLQKSLEGKDTVLKEPVAPLQQVLYERYTRQMALLFLTLLSVLIVAEVISRKSSERTAHALLIERFKSMAAALAAQFATNRRLTDSLEEQVMRRTSALAHSEEKYRLLVENSHDIIYALNKDGVFTFVSNAWTVLLGHALPDVLGHPFRPFVHPDDLALCNGAMADVFEGGHEQLNIEYRVLHVDGTWRWHTSNAMPVRDTQGQVVGYEGIASDITERKRMEGQIHHMAFYDALTKLPNRRLLSDRMGQAMAASKRSMCYGALMFLDLDNFKQLNDQHGHVAGDLLLVEVANRLLASVRAVDTVVRYGGDEFVVMLGELDRDQAESMRQARTVAEKISASLARPYRLNITDFGAPDRVITHRSSACIGVVVFVNHEVAPEDVLKWADRAMYDAKKTGRGSIHFHTAVQHL